MLQLDTTTKAITRANRIVSTLTQGQGNRPNDLGYPIEWFIFPNGIKSLNPNSVLGTVLLFHPHLQHQIHNVIEYIGRYSNWDNVHTELQRRIDNIAALESITPTDTLKVKKYMKIQTLIPDLTQKGVIPKDFITIKVMLKNHRSRLNRALRDIERNASCIDQIQAYKANWSSMTPDRVQEKYLPKGQAVGVEIEWLARAEEDDDHNDGYNRTLRDFDRTSEIHGVSWSYDTSISSSEDYHYETGQETRIMLKYGKWKRLFDVCKYIREQGGEVNRSCGIHIHLDVRDLNKPAAITRGRRLESALPWLLQIIPPTRAKGNTYCKPSFSQSSKYHAITMHSFMRNRKSIEVRMHSASLNPKKIINWIELLWFLKNSYKHYTTIESFIDSSAPFELKEYVLKRRAKFAPVVESNNPEEFDDEQLVEAERPVPPLPAIPPLPDRC